MIIGHLVWPPKLMGEFSTSMSGPKTPKGAHSNLHVAYFVNRRHKKKTYPYKKKKEKRTNMYTQYVL